MLTSMHALPKQRHFAVEHTSDMSYPMRKRDAHPSPSYPIPTKNPQRHKNEHYIMNLIPLNNHLSMR